MSPEKSRRAIKFIVANKIAIQRCTRKEGEKTFRSNVRRKLLSESYKFLSPVYNYKHARENNLLLVAYPPHNGRATRYIKHRYEDLYAACQDLSRLWREKFPGKLHATDTTRILFYIFWDEKYISVYRFQYFSKVY